LDIGKIHLEYKTLYMQPIGSSKPVSPYHYYKEQEKMDIQAWVGKRTGECKMRPKRPKLALYIQALYWEGGKPYLPCPKGRSVLVVKMDGLEVM
jgi:hypothetical protein